MAQNGVTSRSGSRPSVRVDAQAMAARQREISVSEFFAKNRHLLGFDNPRKALLTTVKEAVDNALDACEEGGILPELFIGIEQLGETRFRLTIRDNGPGIVRKQVENIFGRLLYGSKFHRLKMSRGQQGIGIAAAGMYGLMTTGKPMVIHTKPKKRGPCHRVTLAIDTQKNKAEVSDETETYDFPHATGTEVWIELEGRYQRGRQSVDEYLKQTAIANPHARIIYRPPDACGGRGSNGGRNGTAGAAVDGRDARPTVKDARPTIKDARPTVKDGRPTVDKARPAEPSLIDELAHAERLADEASASAVTPGGVVVHPRAVKELPEEPREIKPHPMGVELGTLIKMLRTTENKQLGAFLQNEFSRVSLRVASGICEKAGMTNRTWVSTLRHAEAERLYRAIQETRFMAPPTDCLAPIGARNLLAGLLKGEKAEFYTASTRPAAVYRGNPFQIEVALAYGGKLPAEEPARVIRFANRVPLLYQQSACAAFKAVADTSWRNYGMAQPRGSLPVGPLVVMVHMASVWVPFTSESKEAVADYDEIRKEMKLALAECGRKLKTYLTRRARMRREGQRRDIFTRYIGEVARALHTIDPELEPEALAERFRAIARKRTLEADVRLDEDGRPIRRKAERDPLAGDESTVIVEGEIGGKDEGESGEGAGVGRRVAGDVGDEGDEDQGDLFE